MDPQAGSGVACRHEVLLRLAYLTVTNTFAVLRLLPMSDRDKDVETKADLRRCLHQFELHYNEHRPHQAMHQAAPLRVLPAPITDPDRIARLDIRRNDRLGGIVCDYQHAGSWAGFATASPVRRRRS
jgi:hypothetical protein